MAIQNFLDTAWHAAYVKFQEDAAFAQRKLEQELSNLVGRVIGEPWRESFVFRQTNLQSANGNDAFELYEENGKIVICGRNGVAMASGLNHYLKRYAHVNYNPIFEGNVRMPEQLPHIAGKIRKETSYSVRYALNFCTFSYTMAFWGWKEYEALLDWLAMNGVNLMLDIVGQEEIQRRLLRAYGYSEEEILAYLPGPAYLPWFFMQNMSGFGGPLPEAWFEQRVELGRRIHDRMQTFGIVPVLQGYAGMVPVDFDQKHPDAEVLAQGLWCGFTRPSMLRTQARQGKDYFSEAADIFYAKQQEVFGPITHCYAIDPFHEGGIMGDMTPAFVYHRVQEKMLEHDPQAVWLLMQWQGQLNDEKVCSFANPGQVLILDLQADRRSYSDLMERHHIPWIWSMIHNFGGRMGVDGDVVTLANDIPEKFHSSRYMTGIGAAPEAMINGPIMYDLLFDMTWESAPIDCQQYVRQYCQSRYGGSNAHVENAWEILLNTAYGKKHTYAQGAGECVINARPCEVFRSASTWGHSVLEYDQKQFEQTLPELLDAYDNFGCCDAFRYDLADVAKQVLSNTANCLHSEMMEAYQAGDLEKFRSRSGTFLEIIETEDALLSFCPDFSLELWLASARNCLPDADKSVKDLFEFNARALISTWGDYENSEDCLLDYSNRQWAGLTKTYYLPRWKTFVERYEESLVTSNPPKPVRYFDMEWSWANEKSDFSGASYSAADHGLKELVQTVTEKYTQAAVGIQASASSRVPTVNLALGENVTSNVGAAPGYPTSNLTDGRLDTVWKASEPAWPVVLTLDLHEEQPIREIAFSMPQVAGDYPMEYAISACCEGTWTEVPTQAPSRLLGTISTPCNLTASQVRLTLSNKLDVQDFIAELAQLAVYKRD